MRLGEGLVLSIVLFCVFLLQETTSDKDPGGCKPCPTDIVCPKPTKRRCELKRRPCGCCDECALKRRAKCNYKTVPCDSKLTCVNNHGYGLKEIPFDLPDFEGVCRLRAWNGDYSIKAKMVRNFERVIRKSNGK
ncbi:hypothetical protein SNE40_003863 [Patella caerulea]|uniref:IGFBP N-terminal domain-containing protein n=1 Tax=Patella caerulea TaxID=87958 RepID=A0AAN8KC40_PATCE